MNTTGQIRSNRKWFAAGSRYSIAERKVFLKELRAFLQHNREFILAALSGDLSKSEHEAMVSEYIPVMESLNFMLKNLDKFAKPRKVRNSLFNWPSSGRIIPEPYGEVLIFNAWNYPFLLALDPLIGAIAAGNRVLLMASTQAPATSRVLKFILDQWNRPELAQYADANLISTADLLKEKFDYIFFTGGQTMAKEVAAAAARELTPVTLELGGKSPAIVDADADLKIAARRIVWGKFLNAGQTCVAPDYVLAHRTIKDELLTRMRGEIAGFYGDNPEENEYYGRIINLRHFERLAKLLNDGKLVAGGEKNAEKLYIAPTIIDDVSLDSPVMSEEIFGPILPVIEASNLEDAIAIVNRRPKPLALYYFGSKNGNKQKVLTETSSGSVCVNDTVMQLMNPSMPFGGVGESGMGAYHGKYSFDTFTHYKPCMEKPTFPDWKLRYPPYGKALTALLKSWFQ